MTFNASISDLNTKVSKRYNNLIQTITQPFVNWRKKLIDRVCVDPKQAMNLGKSQGKSLSEAIAQFFAMIILAPLIMLLVMMLNSILIIPIIPVLLGSVMLEYVSVGVATLLFGIALPFAYMFLFAKASFDSVLSLWNCNSKCDDIVNSAEATKLSSAVSVNTLENNAVKLINKNHEGCNLRMFEKGCADSIVNTAHASEFMSDDEVFYSCDDGSDSENCSIGSYRSV